MSYDKTQVKESLELEDIYEILDSLGAEPEIHDDYLTAITICHGGDSHKLYYYNNTQLFKCFSGSCGTFDIFELLQKVRQLELNEAIFYVVNFFNLQYKLTEVDDLTLQEDWRAFKKYEELTSIKINHSKIELPEFSKDILKKYPQPKILNWEQDHITKEICDYMDIHYDPLSGNILIPHTDEHNRLIGIRQRTLVQEEEQWGKYRPWSQMVWDSKNKQWKPKLYNHPLAFNLYGYYQAKENISKMGVALVFESEKSTLAAMSYLGLANNLAVAVCGSSLSKYQFQMLLDAGANEICIGFDADYHQIGDEDWKETVTKWEKINQKFGNYVNISFLYDKEGDKLGYKCSPTDCGKEVFMELWKSRMYL